MIRRLLMMIRPTCHKVSRIRVSPYARPVIFRPFCTSHEVSDTDRTQTTQDKLPLDVDDEFDVIYTNEKSVCENWIRKSILGQLGEDGTLAVGLDVEWRPNFTPKAKGGTQNKTAVVQLSVSTSALVYHIFHARRIPSNLGEMLANPRVLKVGVGVGEDARKLWGDYGLSTEGLLDLAVMANVKGVPKEAGRGVKMMCVNLLNLTIDKPKRVSMSNWEKFPLESSQIQYAALDAWLSFKIYEKLASMPNALPPEQAEPQQSTASGSGERPAKMGGRAWRANCPFVCPACNKKCKSQSELDQHIVESEHPKCPHCQKLFVKVVPKKHLRLCENSRYL